MNQRSFILLPKKLVSMVTDNSEGSAIIPSLWIMFIVMFNAYIVSVKLLWQFSQQSVGKSSYFVFIKLQNKMT